MITLGIEKSTLIRYTVRIINFPMFIISILVALIFYILYKIFGAYEYFNSAIGFDQAGNALLGGNPDQTISGRLGKRILNKNDNCIWCIKLCKVLSWFFNEDYHCLSSIDENET